MTEENDQKINAPEDKNTSGSTNEKEEPKVDIPKDKKDDEAVEAERDKEKGRRPRMVKKGFRSSRDRRNEAEWIPKTKLGQMVKTGKITSMTAALKSEYPLREPEIVDHLIGEDLEDEVLKVNMVQRMTDSGRRTRFSITVVVGNSNGYVGLGAARGKEVGPTIKKAIDNAKLNMVELVRGCGSWECGCKTPHSLPFKVIGKSGSTVVTLRSAPRGVGLAVGDVAKKILKLAGINDAWGFSRGQTKTTVNNAKAVMDALLQTNLVKVQPGQRLELKHLSGVRPMESPQEQGTAGGDIK
jgi:small subunit ribosomal protein S5